MGRRIDDTDAGKRGTARGPVRSVGNRNLSRRRPCIGSSNAAGYRAPFAITGDDARVAQAAGRYGGGRDSAGIFPAQKAPDRLVQLVFTETEGVPFFVEGMYRHLAEERQLTDAAGKWLPEVEIGEIEVPEAVRLVLGRRIDRIGETAQGILTTAACIGRIFTFDSLSSASEAGEDALLDALEEAERAKLVIAEEGRQPHFVFAHEQIRQTLLGRLSFLRRQRLHKRIADALEKLYEHEPRRACERARLSSNARRCR